MSVIGKRETLHERFEIQASLTPDNIAIEFNGHSLSYKELSLRSSIVATELEPLVSKTVELVGLYIDRSIDMIVGLLGILKAGAAYVPIDPGYPKERIQFLLKDSDINIVVSRQEDKTHIIGNCSLVLVDKLTVTDPIVTSVKPVEPCDAAYVIYTSGSTGIPKGTVIEHRNIVRLFDSTYKLFNFDSSDVWTLFHSISFDFSIWEMWGALLYGGRLVIVPSEITASTTQFCKLVRNRGITILSQTPTAFNQFSRTSIVNKTNYPNLREIIFGGERLEITQLQSWINHYGDDQPKLINMYGITETTVHVTYRRIKTKDLEFPYRSPIGLPLSDLEIHLLGGNGFEPPNGRPGEIIVTGAGVSRGYLNRTELTAERFPLLPLGEGGKLVHAFKSGDYACRMDGELFYIGREDNQVKVRGYRIELHEIEMCIEKLSEVSRCAVLTQDLGEGDTQLIAIIEPTTGISNIVEKIKKDVSQLLPSYMVPSRVIEINEIPRTTHDKLDKKALFEYLNTYPSSTNLSSSKTSGTTEQVAELSGVILKRADVVWDVDLFDQGATSLSFTRILIEINEKFGVDIIGPELRGDSSINNIATVIDSISKSRNTIEETYQ